MKTLLSGIAIVTACRPITCDVFAWSNKPAFLIKNISPLLTKRKSNHSYFIYEEMIKFGPEDYEKKTRFQTFLTSAGFGVSSTSYKALTAEGIETMGSFLPMEAKLFS